ncbi:MAG TPA: B12-binding domain-containing radical SAM protein [Kofleriaceae bacterium]|nr:B12-binding domain-containing radical SAM protein [Kofleriaceae bacterium]
MKRVRVIDVAIVQLPFPAMAEPHPLVRDYYRDYSLRYREVVDYWVPDGSLWELPLWIAHLAGMIRDAGSTARVTDLSQLAADERVCADRLIAETAPGDVIMLSPLAQNFDLALAVSRKLMQVGRRTVIGGNMAGLVPEGAASHVHQGILTRDSLEQVLHGGGIGVSRILPRRGRGGRLDSVPDYAQLRHYRGKVPLLRLNASHGCLYQCSFCGDAWSKQLHVVAPEVLEQEVQQFEELFPEARLIYIGDKTFGQSREGIANLLALFARRPRYRFIVQTHVLQVNERLIDAMRQLGVVIVEMGFETADSEVLRESHKEVRGVEHYARVIEQLTAAGMRVILNVMGGLPHERAESHVDTLAFLRGPRNQAWLYNLYSFVPYPLTPIFPELKERIHDWSFANWREDARPVFHPYHASPDETFGWFLEKVAVAHDLIRDRHVG